MVTRLSIRINKLSAAERLRLCRKLGIGQTTLYRRLSKPGTFQIDELDRMKLYLDKLDGADYNMRHLCMSPIIVRGKRDNA